MSEHFIAFWNVENLFDTFDSAQRPDWLQAELAEELTDWTAAVLAKKVEQLAEIILALNNGAGPDILGLCEIENRPVLAQLVGALQPLNRNYDIAHADTADKRGIDVGFIFDADKYQKGLQFQHFVQKRTATRDIFQVNLTTAAGRDLIVVGNHWPSRSGGQLRSEPYRMMVGETLAYFHSRILEEKGRDVAIVAMGDFNDEPFDRSIRDYALAIRNGAKIMNATSRPYFLNLMWEETGSRDASYYFGNTPNVLDQFWVSRGIVKQGSPFSVKAGSVKVERFAQMNSGGDYPAPIRFGRPSKPSSFNDGGYSDHYPVSMILTEAGAVA